MSENTKTPLTPLNKLQATVTEMGETVFTASTDCVLHQLKLYGRVAMRKKAHIKSHLKLKASTGRRFYGETTISLFEVLKDVFLY